MEKIAKQGYKKICDEGRYALYMKSPMALIWDKQEKKVVMHYNTHKKIKWDKYTDQA